VADFQVRAEEIDLPTDRNGKAGSEASRLNFLLFTYTDSEKAVARLTQLFYHASLTLDRASMGVISMFRVYFANEKKREG
jgi:hypothetical protein